MNIFVLSLMLALGVQAQKPLDAYLAYRAAFEHAQDFTALRPFLAAEVVKQIDAASPADRQQLFATLKRSGAVWQVSLVSDAKLPAGGHLLTVFGVDGKDRPLQGTVELVADGDTWKIMRETWARP